MNNKKIVEMWVSVTPKGLFTAWEKQNKIRILHWRDDTWRESWILAFHYICVDRAK